MPSPLPDRTGDRPKSSVSQTFRSSSQHFRGPPRASALSRSHWDRRVSAGPPSTRLDAAATATRRPQPPEDHPTPADRAPGASSPGARSRLESRRSQSTPEHRLSAGPLLRYIGGDSGWGSRRTMTRQRFTSGSALGSNGTLGPGRPAHPSSRPAPRIRPRVLWTPICRPPTPPRCLRQRTQWV